ncbi:hypothetical protein [uncultured Hoeflea sp.]|uniref:hypothetical protein n=1 Tax=uncultured Hoeflea sp. TaxID=538666 RepID=UPI002622A4CA|nr:hypothetical protein [uncultured Hoeflea sp.]
MNDRPNKDMSGTIRLAGAASILLACAIGWWLDPLGEPMLSAGVLGLVAGLSFALRGLFKSKS